MREMFPHMFPVQKQTVREKDEAWFEEHRTPKSESPIDDQKNIFHDPNPIWSPLNRVHESGLGHCWAVVESIYWFLRVVNMILVCIYDDKTPK